MMLRSRRAPLAVAAASLLAFSGCESATGSAREAGGTVTFTYAGDHAGAYEARGRFSRTSTSWAFANRGTVAGGEAALTVLARTGRAGRSRVDDFLLTVRNPAVGTITCTDAAADDCGVAALLLLGATPDGSDVEVIYGSTSGTVTITSIDDDMARGTFVLAMLALDLDEEPREVQVTSGTFQVPIVRGAF